MNSDDINLTAAAYHEAGHVVISHHLGFKPKQLQLFWNPIHGRWNGMVESAMAITTADIMQLSSFNTFDLRAKQAQICLAGMISQAKYLAIQGYGEGTKYDANFDLTNMVEFIRNETRAEESPGKIEFSFVLPSGHLAVLLLEGHCFSGKDCQSFNEMLRKEDGLIPKTLLSQAIQLIDDTSNWEKIKCIANLALEQLSMGEDQKRILSQDQLNVVLNR